MILRPRVPITPQEVQKIEANLTLLETAMRLDSMAKLPEYLEYLGRVLEVNKKLEGRVQLRVGDDSVRRKRFAEIILSARNNVMGL